VFEFGVPKYSEARDRVVVSVAPLAAGLRGHPRARADAGCMEEWAESVRQGWTGILAGSFAELSRGGGKPRHPWVAEFPGAITVCDRNGVIIEVNATAAATFADDGGAALVGSNLLDCHPSRRARWWQACCQPAGECLHRREARCAQR